MLPGSLPEDTRTPTLEGSAELLALPYPTGPSVEFTTHCSSFEAPFLGLLFESRRPPTFK